MQQLALDVAAMQQAGDVSAPALASATQRLGGDVTAFPLSLIALAAATSDEARRGQLLALSKALLDSLAALLKVWPQLNRRFPNDPCTSPHLGLPLPDLTCRLDLT